MEILYEGVGGSKQVGTLVRMIDEPHGIFGIITGVIDDRHRGDKIYYKVSWIDELCGPTYADEDVLEVICE